jgi:hypothetical protein
MKFNRFLFQLQVSTHHTKGKESGLLLTPTTKEDPVNLEKFKKRMEKYPNGTTMPNLATQIMSLLPTPLAAEGGKMSGSETENQMSVTKLMKREYGQTSQLNPQFVEEMMGFPENWTLLPFLNGERNLSKDMEMR